MHPGACGITSQTPGSRHCRYGIAGWRIWKAPTGNPHAACSHESRTSHAADSHSLRPRLEKTLTEAKAVQGPQEFEPHLTRAKQMLAELTKQGATNQQINREMAKFELLEAGLAITEDCGRNLYASSRVDIANAEEAPQPGAFRATHHIANNAPRHPGQKLSANPDHRTARIPSPTSWMPRDSRKTISMRLSTTGAMAAAGKHGVLEGTLRAASQILACVMPLGRAGERSGMCR